MTSPHTLYFHPRMKRHCSRTHRCGCCFSGGYVAGRHSPYCMAASIFPHIPHLLHAVTDGHWQLVSFDTRVRIIRHVTARHTLRDHVTYDTSQPTHLADLHLPSPASLSAVTREGGGPNMQPGCKKMCVSLHYNHYIYVENRFILLIAAVYGSMYSGLRPSRPCRRRRKSRPRDRRGWP